MVTSPFARALLTAALALGVRSSAFAQPADLIFHNATVWTVDDASPAARARTPFTPDVRRVEDLTHRHPMFLNKFDNSEYAANTATFRAAGLDPDNPQAEGVEFLRGPDGKPTGIMKGRRVTAVFNRV